MKFSFDIFNEWRKRLDNVNDCKSKVRLPECIGLMNDLYKSDKYRPIQVMFYLTFDRIDDKTYLILQPAYLNVFELSLKRLYVEILSEYEKEPKFVGFISDEFGIDYYLHQIKELYPEEDIIVNAGCINQMNNFISSLCGMF